MIISILLLKRRYQIGITSFSIHYHSLPYIYYSYYFDLRIISFHFARSHNQLCRALFSFRHWEMEHSQSSEYISVDSYTHSEKLTFPSDFFRKNSQNNKLFSIITAFRNSEIGLKSGLWSSHRPHRLCSQTFQYSQSLFHQQSCMRIITLYQLKSLLNPTSMWSELIFSSPWKYCK